MGERKVVRLLSHVDALGVKVGCRRRAMSNKGVTNEGCARCYGPPDGKKLHVEGGLWSHERCHKEGQVLLRRAQLIDALFDAASVATEHVFNLNVPQ